MSRGASQRTRSDRGRWLRLPSLTAREGQALYIPAGELHMVINRGDEETIYIGITAPPPN